MGTKQKPSRGNQSGSSSGARPGEKKLFHERLKGAGKWVYVVLAVVFAGSFVLFGVGNSGGFGLQDILQNGGSGGGNTTTEVTSADLKKALTDSKAHPKDPAVWATLGAAYTSSAGERAGTPAAQGDYARAVDAYKTASELKKDDVEILTALANAYNAQAGNAQAQTQQIYADAQQLSATKSGADNLAPGGPTNVNPFASASDAQIDKAVSDLYAKAAPLSTVSSDATKKALEIYLKLTTLRPKDPATWFEMAQAAQSSGDTANAIKGYKKFLELVPSDPLSPAVKTVVDSLEGKTTPTVGATGTDAATTATAGTTTGS